MTQERLKKFMEYDKHTGWFINKKNRGGLKIGDRCGCVHTIAKYGYTYRLVAVDGKQYKEHQLVWLYMTGSFAPKGFEIDHIDGDATNNTWNNLQLLTHQQNILKAKRAKNNTSGHTGVTWDKARSKWCAQIMINGKTQNLGRFVDVNDAINARKNAENKFIKPSSCVQ